MADPERNVSERTTTTTTTTDNGGSGMGFIVGALVVIVAIIAYFLFVGADTDTAGGDINVTVEGSDTAPAADAVEGTAEEGTVATD